jgi:5'-3' exonuclease
VAIAFDNPIRSIRNEWFDEYKSDEGVLPALLAQFDAAEDAARALGMVVWSMDRYEADDALATGATRWRDDVEQVRIMTPDKDLGQCLRGGHVVQVDRMRSRVIDEAALLASVGIAPASVPDFLALVGDTADGIPGLPGFGKKTAAALLLAYRHLEDIPAKGSAWGPKVRGADVLATTLVEHREQALLYRRLATLVERGCPKGPSRLGARRCPRPMACASSPRGRRLPSRGPDERGACYVRAHDRANACRRVDRPPRSPDLPRRPRHVR